MEPGSVVGFVMSALEVKDRLFSLLNRLLIGLIVIPLSIVVWLSLLAPDSFDPVGILGGLAEWFARNLEVRANLAAWVHSPAQWLAERPQLGPIFIAIALVTALACRPSLHRGRSLQPNPLVLALCWVAGCAAIVCGYREWLTGLGIATFALLLVAKLLPGEAVQDSAQHMLESFVVAVFLSPVCVITPVVALWYRIAGIVPQQTIKPAPHPEGRPRPEAVAAVHRTPPPTDTTSPELYG